MIWVDYSGGYAPWLALHGDREWKKYQHQFYAVDMKRIAADAKAAEVKANEAGMSKMQEELAKTKLELEGKKPEEEKITGRCGSSTGGRRPDHAPVSPWKKPCATRSGPCTKRLSNANNMNMDAPEVRESKDKAESQNELVAKLDLRKQQADAKLQAAKDALTALMGHEVELEHNIKRFDDGIKLLTTRYKQLDSALVQGVVNFPVIEFAAGTIKVEQIIADKHPTPM